MIINSLCVFCGSSSGGDVYEQQAQLLGQAFGKRGINLVYGGGSLGLMGIVARTVTEQGRDVTGIIPKALNNLTQPIGKNIVVNTMHERKAMMQELSDGFIAMPGGFGTCEELFEIITWSQLRIHNKPIAIFNVNGYYDHLIKFIDGAVENGFIDQLSRRCVIVHDTVDSLLDGIINFEDPYAGGNALLTRASWHITQSEV